MKTAVALALLASTLALACDTGGERAATPNTTTASAATALVLNEIGPVPVGGTAAFVEIANPTPGDRGLAGLSLVNEAGAAIDLPPLTVPSGGIVLVTFDGRDAVEGMTIHSASPSLVGASGSISLAPRGQPGAAIDVVSWGDIPGGLPLAVGGAIVPPEAGTTLGRAPGATGPLPWIAYEAALGSPGKANPPAPVTVLVPDTGAILDSTATLTFYGVPGAARYRVQVATNEAFTNPVLDRTVETPSVEATLSDGDYLWRVDAVLGDGTVVGAPRLSRFAVRKGVAAGLTPAQAGTPTAQGGLPVVVFAQHKDTRMLHLESLNEKGGHAWNTAHVGYEASDPADQYNCALASIQMINRYYGGNASQDRIGYEIHKDDVKGPEGDLNYGAGNDEANMRRGMKWALGVDPGTSRVDYHLAKSDATREKFWMEVRGSIDAKKPVLVDVGKHAVVVSGYSDGPSGRRVLIRDPAGNTYAADVATMSIVQYWLLPDGVTARSDEPGIALDSDGDGIVDFDESERFHTNPKKADSDGDGRSDGVEVRQSIFDPHGGFFRRSSSQKQRFDIDNDKLAMELDIDSDGGGCIDGVEDDDHDGVRAGQESDNFDKQDDVCVTGVVDVSGTIKSGGNFVEVIHWTTTFSARATKDTKMTGKAVVVVSVQTEGDNDKDCAGRWTAVRDGVESSDVEISLDIPSRALLVRRTGPYPQCTTTVSGMCYAVPPTSSNCNTDANGGAQLDESWKSDTTSEVVLNDDRQGKLVTHSVWDASKATR